MTKTIKIMKNIRKPSAEGSKTVGRIELSLTRDQIDEYRKNAARRRERAGSQVARHPAAPIDKHHPHPP